MFFHIYVVVHTVKLNNFGFTNLFKKLYSLLNSEGSPLAFISDSDRDARVYAAIASNIWSTFEKNGKNLMRDDNLKFLLVECEVNNFLNFLPFIFIIYSHYY